MNARERLMAIVVGVLLGCGALYYIYDWVMSGFDEREKQKTTLQEQLNEKRRKLKIANRAKARLKSYEERSLPSDADIARSLYQTWLLELLDEAGLHDVNVTIPGGARGRQGAYVRHTFEMSGRGDLSQLTALLFDFHWVSRLHRITRFSAAPIKESKDLDIKLTIEALSLPGATLTDSLSEEPANRLTLSDVAEYENVIVGRNLFAPANHPPKLASVSGQKAFVNTKFSMTVKAQDPDKLDAVTYRLADGAPTGVVLNPKTGELSWTPKEKGDFQARVIATDNGLPARTDEQLIKFTVSDPPPPPPAAAPTKRKLDFDNAKFTFLSGITELDGRTEAWFTVRTTGELLKLRVGQKINIGSIEGKVAKIEAESVEISTKEKPITVELGQNLLGSTEAK